MDAAKQQLQTIDEYINSFPKDVQEILQTLRKAIKEEVSSAEEAISYGIPTVKLQGKYVVYFAGYKKHISIYPVFAEMEKLLPEIAQFRTGKGTLQFSLEKPLPMPLIRQIVKLLLKANQQGTKSYS